MNILLVEDDPILATGLVKILQDNGFIVNHVSQGNHAISVVKTDPPDMVILDLGLPDISGIDVVKALRPKFASIPVLMLTARDSTESKVQGLEAGADDYLTKPFDIKELIARLHVFERRLSTVNSNQLTIGEVCLDIQANQASVNGIALSLSRRELMLLKALMESAGKILSKEQLESKLYHWGEDISSNTIEVHIHNLRKKLHKDFIKNIRGIGYTIQAP